MSPGDADQFVANWFLTEGKVFDYKDYGWFDTEVLVIIRKDVDLFVVDEKKSTVKDGPFNREQIINLMCRDLLVYKPYSSINTNYKEERASYCVCGAWRTTNPNAHAFYCTKYKRY